MKTLSELLQSSSFTSTAFLVVLAVVASAILRSSARSSRLPYPPGPKGYWFIGLPSVPLERSWQRYVEWGRKYAWDSYSGDLIHYTRFGKHYLVLNSFEAANELLEKQARLSSDRSHTALDRLATYESILSTAPYSEDWRKLRKIFHQSFRAEASTKYHQIEINQIERFISQITSANPGSLLDQIMTLSQRIMFTALYGLDISSNKEDMAHDAREVIEAHDFLFLPGWDAFKNIPFIHRLPSWFPGGHIKVFHKQVGQVLAELGAGPFNATLGLMKSDNAHSSIVAELVSAAEGREDFAEEMTRIRNMGLQSIIAASDTTMSAIATFFLAMSLYPDVQRKGQQELDNVLGPGKLPTFADRDSLPYIEAIYREVMRWHPAIPMGLPHETVAPMIYRGYYIPKGTAIYGNIWAMSRDPLVWEKPEEFIPERHLSKEGPFEHINSMLAYGFGRRICVGRWMANDLLFISIAMILATVNISGPAADNAKMDIEDRYTEHGFCSPKFLDCTVTSRFGNVSNN